MKNTHKKAILPARIITILVAVMLFCPSTKPTAMANDGSNGTIPLLVKSSVPLTAEVEASISAHAATVSHAWTEIDAMAIRVTPAKMGALVSDPAVAAVEPDYQGQIQPGVSADAPDELPSESASLDQSFALESLLQTWDRDMVDTNPAETGFDGTGVTVVVMDSGFPQNWSDFLPAGSVDTANATGFGAMGWGTGNNTLNPINGQGGYTGLDSHAMGVSSVIVGFPSRWGPIAGAAPGVKILPVRVLNQFGWGYYSWFAAGIVHVANLKRDAVLSGPVVINFSIGGENDSLVLKSAIDYAIAQGVLFVTSAGNNGKEGPGSVGFPARYGPVISVGGMLWRRLVSVFGDVFEDDPTEVVVWEFSSREPLDVPPATQIDVIAPSALVMGLTLNSPGFSEGRVDPFDGVNFFIQGTSFAAPHVAGILAQMLQKDPTLTQGEAEAILRNSALAIPPAPDGVFLPLFNRQSPPWGANATGKGLARARAALAQIP